MLHQGHVSVNKMDQSAEAFRWPRMHREVREKAENGPTCRAAGKSFKTQIPHTEVNRFEILTDRTKKFNWIPPVQSNPKHAERFIF